MKNLNFQVYETYFCQDYFHHGNPVSFYIAHMIAQDFLLLFMFDTSWIE